MMASGPLEKMGFSGSYDPQDVTFLLKRVALAPTDLETKERMIQSGRRHYSEMLPQEHVPAEDYIALYEAALDRNARRLAEDIATLAAALDERAEAGREIAIASLVRAGTPIGVLVMRALRRRGRSVAHYSLSIIRDRGIDLEALGHIAARHDPRDVVFIDGWTGKGAIAAELRSSLRENPYGVRPFLAVVADPAGSADLAATGEDYLIPSGLLNGVVSGLVSRSILNAELVGAGDFHACVEYPEMADHDRSRAFIDRIDALVPDALARPALASHAERSTRARACETLVRSLMARCGIDDRNRIKPGIAEATRALLRRTPHCLFLRDPADPDVRHLLHLAGLRDIAVDSLPIASDYRAVTVIRTLRPDRAEQFRD